MVRIAVRFRVRGGAGGEIAEGGGVRGWLELVVCVGLAGCGAEQLEAIGVEVQLAPAALDFGLVTVGVPARRVVSVTNQTAAPVDLAVTVDAPFSTPDATLRLLGGERRDVSVECLARRPGRAASRLLVSTPDGQQFAVGLAATVQAAVRCDPVNDCDAPVLVDGRCEHRPVSDGAACASACLTASVCVGGQCVGQPLDCDDGDACTDDACGDGACRHTPRVCAPSTDPCLASVCDAVTGCRAVPVADGTSCGPNDCTTAKVCITGACVARTPPNGSVCAHAEGCQNESHCTDGRCVPGARFPLFPSWTFQANNGNALLGLRADERGNLYLLERSSSDPQSKSLVSIDARGALRFRVPLLTRQFDVPSMLVSDDVVVVTGTEHRFDGPMLLEAHDASDGRLLWSHTPQSLFATGEPVCSYRYQPFIGADGHGHLFFRADLSEACAATGVGFAVLDLHTGSPLAKRITAPFGPGVLRQSVIDASGRWVGVEPDGSFLAARTSTLNVAWNSSPAHAPVAASPGGRLVTHDSHVLFPMGSAVAGSALGSPFGAGGALIGRLERAFLLTRTSGIETVVKHDLERATRLWSYVLPDDAPSQFGYLGTLTERDSVVFSLTDRGPENELIEVSWEGEERSRCLLQSRVGTARVLPTGQAVVLDGLWVTYDAMHGAVSAFPMPGLRPAQHGWVNSSGTPGGEMRPK